jgi:hypothetical protein
MTKFHRFLKILFRYFPENIRKKHYDRVVQKWKSKGSPVPPPHIIKERTVEQYRQEYNCDILVETGTYRGDMIYAGRNYFKQIYSIELDSNLHKKALKKFKKYSHIEIYQGDSGAVLQKIIPKLDRPTLFWLDAHYSGGITAKGEKECPVFEELATIFSSTHHHIVLIDDARCFTGKHDYPTIKALEEFVFQHKPEYTLRVKDDIIRLTY